MTDLKIFNSLPIKDHIADIPQNPRDHSNLMIIDRKSEKIYHKKFYEIIDYLNKDDYIVINESKVFNAKLKAKKKTGAKTEFLLVKKIDENSNKWILLSRKTKPGFEYELEDGTKAICLERNPDGSFTFEFEKPLNEAYLREYALPPLPSYIENKRKEKNTPLYLEKDIEKYQTVYASQTGSIAAPTAGFHFTKDLIEKLEKKGIIFKKIILHIGWGTFKPIRTKIEEHIMGEEFCSIDEKTASDLNNAKKNGNRIIAVGTSSIRTLETLSDENGNIFSGFKNANIFIYPPYKFKVPNCFITNFHVPDSPPLSMTSAFCGTELLFKAYQEAIKNNYRFYSYGDSMMII